MNDRWWEKVLSVIWIGSGVAFVIMCGVLLLMLMLGVGGAPGSTP